jgi:hypothetical protein
VTGNSHSKMGGPIAKGEHIDEGETGEHKWGDSAQHMLHCMSQYNIGTLRKKGGAHAAWARTNGRSSTE